MIPKQNNLLSKYLSKETAGRVQKTSTLQDAAQLPVVQEQSGENPDDDSDISSIKAPENVLDQSTIVLDKTDAVEIEDQQKKDDPYVEFAAVFKPTSTPYKTIPFLSESASSKLAEMIDSANNSTDEYNNKEVWFVDTDDFDDDSEASDDSDDTIIDVLETQLFTFLQWKKFF